jgi:hypothetical protein
MKNTAILLALLAAAPAKADVLFLNDGSEITGKVVSADASGVKLSAGGAEKTYPRASLMKIQFVKEYAAGDPLQEPETARLLAAPPSQEAYPNDGYLNWLDETVIDVNPDRSWKMSRRGLRSVLRERGKSPAAYLSYTELPGIEKGRIDYAYSVTGGKVSWLTDLSVMDGSPNVGYPRYDRLKLVKYAIPNVQTGSALGYGYTFENVYASTYPFFADIALRGYEPVKTARLIVTVPEPLKLAYFEFNLPKGTVFSKTARDGKNVYTWETPELPAYRSREANSPPYLRYAPQVLLSLEDSWEDLRARLAPLLAERLVVTDAMKAKAAELSAGSKSDLEKAEAIYNWVAVEIKYQDVDLSDYSYLPKPAAETFDARSGNPLDKPFVLYALLEAAGLKPGFAYVRSKYAPFAEKLPNLRQFDYAECVLDAGGKTLALAPLGDKRRFTELYSPLQGAKAFRVLGAGPALFDNPDHAAAEEASRTEAVYALDADGNLSGSYATKLTGESQASLRGFKDYKKEDMDRSMEEYVHSIHPLARLKSYRLENLRDLGKDLEFSISLEAAGYAMKAGRYMIFKLPAMNYSAADAAQTERELPLFWYSRSLLASEIRIKLPPGYSLYHAPRPPALNLAGHTYAAAFRTAPGELVYSGELTRNAVWLPAEGYPDYKAFSEAMAGFSDSWIVLERK